MFFLWSWVELMGSGKQAAGNSYPAERCYLLTDRKHSKPDWYIVRVELQTLMLEFWLHLNAGNFSQTTCTYRYKPGVGSPFASVASDGLTVLAANFARSRSSRFLRSAFSTSSMTI
jgi:hypothetical protein